MTKIKRVIISLLVLTLLLTSGKYYYSNLIKYGII